MFQHLVAQNSKFCQFSIKKLCNYEEKIPHLKNTRSQISLYFDNVSQISPIFGEIVYLWGKKITHLKNISHEKIHI